MRYMRNRRGSRRNRNSRGNARSVGRRDVDEPLTGVANLFDVAMVFALGLMVVLLMYYNLQELLKPQDVTIVKNPGQKNMEIIVKHGKKIERLNMTNQTVQAEIIGEWARIYETKGGGKILVPSNESEGSSPP